MCPLILQGIGSELTDEYNGTVIGKPPSQA